VWIVLRNEAKYPFRCVQEKIDPDLSLADGNKAQTKKRTGFVKNMSRKGDAGNAVENRARNF
jgi:hypothetical protein